MPSDPRDNQPPPADDNYLDQGRVISGRNPPAGEKEKSAKDKPLHQGGSEATKAGEVKPGVPGGKRQPTLPDHDVDARYSQRRPNVRE